MFSTNSSDKCVKDGGFLYGFHNVWSQLIEVTINFHLFQIFRIGVLDVTWYCAVYIVYVRSNSLQSFDEPFYIIRVFGAKKYDLFWYIMGNSL